MVCHGVRIVDQVRRDFNTGCDADSSDADVSGGGAAPVVGTPTRANVLRETGRFALLRPCRPGYGGATRPLAVREDPRR